jgi:Kef-type K+ transport system membrane component KefB
MIQRIQSVFLLLSSIFNFSLFLQPVYFASRVTEMDAGATSNPIWADGKFNIWDSKVLIIFSILAGISALGAIFLYNNRRLQQKIAYLSAVDGLVTVAMAGLLMSQYREGNLSGWAWGVDILGIVSALLAARFIGKDEKLVRSSDRLR